VFGRIGALMQARDRAGVLGHLENVATMLDPACADLQWDLATARPHRESGRSMPHSTEACSEPGVRERKSGDADVAP
jgi:hypothetical protein